MNQYRILLPPSSLREMQRSFTSSTFLFPSYNVWSKDEVSKCISMITSFCPICSEKVLRNVLDIVVKLISQVQYYEVAHCLLGTR